ncbi:MAG TPA: hypothetical protein VFW00_07230 [Rhodocyclaceae bacterium]|nr:hypothetical protein [Rhodocyclaceae bacterium]
MRVGECGMLARSKARSHGTAARLAFANVDKPMKPEISAGHQHQSQARPERDRGLFHLENAMRIITKLIGAGSGG